MTCAATTADQAARTNAIRADLTWIGESWQDLYELRLPGKRRTAPRRPMSRAARERADELARIEKAEQGLSILGASQAPMDVSVLDTLADLLAQLCELDDRLTLTAGVADVEPPSTAYDFEAIGRIVAHASEVLPIAADVDPGALDEAEHAVRRLRARLASALGDLTDGQVLPGLCAWCHGATSEAPAGGERTLTVHVVADQTLIVCESDLCDPPAEDCGTWLKGKPAWRDHEWGWLAQRMEAA
ncbi:hypothetical protein NGM33_28555 [Nocardiopsis dassonvillei]|uniref:hypothetical protein n=1 Tax=Nocardiopsis dassonvillei TaxID=2014 RepID=UPI0020A234E0|nr:hypothetical protein [Nocardiopsis dassonvillei]MCP3017288.1 hypothetical protein [Nocardiopsis dassonvillei]